MSASKSRNERVWCAQSAVMASVAGSGGSGAAASGAGAALPDEELPQPKDRARAATTPVRAPWILSASFIYALYTTGRLAVQARVAPEPPSSDLREDVGFPKRRT